MTSFVSTVTECENSNQLSDSKSLRIPYNTEREYHLVQHKVDMEMRRNNGVYGYHGWFLVYLVLALPLCWHNWIWVSPIIHVLQLQRVYHLSVLAYSKNRVVFTCSSILSIESPFALCIYNYFSSLNNSCVSIPIFIMM